MGWSVLFQYTILSIYILLFSIIFLASVLFHRFFALSLEVFLYLYILHFLLPISLFTYLQQQLQCQHLPNCVFDTPNSVVPPFVIAFIIAVTIFSDDIKYNSSFHFGLFVLICLLFIMKSTMISLLIQSCFVSMQCIISFLTCIHSSYNCICAIGLVHSTKYLNLNNRYSKLSKSTNFTLGCPFIIFLAFL